VSWSFGKLLAYRTTGIRPALFSVSRLYRIGYSALEVAYGRRLVLAVLLRLNSYLPPFRCPESEASVQALLCPYSVFKVLFVFQLHY
jgi:hypothetical protein